MKITDMPVQLQPPPGGRTPPFKATLSLTHQSVIDGTVEISLSADGEVCGGTFFVPTNVFAQSITQQDALISVQEEKIDLKVNIRNCPAPAPAHHFHFKCLAVTTKR